MVRRGTSLGVAIVTVLLGIGFHFWTGIAETVSQAGKPSTARTMPFRLYANTVFFTARVNDSRPLSFLLDTAAGASVLNRSTAESLGLPFIAEHDQRNAGSGDNPTRIAVLPGGTISLDLWTLNLPRLVAVPMDEVARSYGTQLDGLIGYELMAEYVVQIDYDAQTLTLIDPGSFEYKGRGAVLPLELRGHEPIVRAQLGLPGKDPIEAAFLVDAPHPRSMTFGSPFARKHDLRSAMLQVTRRLLPSAAYGVGGRTDLQAGRIQWIQFGPHRLKLPDASFATDAKGGAFAREDIAGILGGEIFRRFRVILDYSRQRMILEPGLHFDEPFEVDASGLLLRVAKLPHQEFEIADVIPDTPGAEAGLKKDDRIVAIDGTPASQLTLWQVRTMLRKTPRDCVLSLGGGGEPRKITLRTRPLL